MNEDLVTASVTVPRVRLADLLDFAAALLREESRAINGTVPSAQKRAPADSRAGDAARPTLEDWQAGDVELAAEVMRSSASDRVRGAWRALAASGPQNRLTGPALDKAVGIEGRRRNGVLSRMVASCRVRNRVSPWRWDNTNNTYWMEARVAHIFTRALALL